MQFLDNTDFQKIENALDIQLPLHYKKFHLERHDLLLRLNKAQSAIDDNMDVYTHADSIIQDNKMFAVPKNKIIIGQDGCGGYYFIDISPNSNDETVYTIPHDVLDEDEIFDKEANDYIWTHPDCQTAENLAQYAINCCETWEYVREIK
jgi:SMI1 / KNR4 family (SUKH-1)